MAKSVEEIASLLENTKFKRKFFGGVDEEDVWRKLDRLQSEYAELLELTKGQYGLLLSQWQEYALSLERQVQDDTKIPWGDAAKNFGTPDIDAQGAKDGWAK